MSRVISGNTLLEAVKNGTFMENGSVSNCDGIKYDFQLDSLFLKSEFGAPVDYSSLTTEEKKSAIIAPGEMVFVITKETLTLPENVFLQLSPKRKMTEFGVLTLGGFAVDPGYRGKLMFGLYNISSDNFRLLPGNKLVGAVFHQLEENEIVKNYQPPKPIDGFPASLIEKIAKYQSVGMNSLEDSIKAIESQLETIKSSLCKNTNDIEKLEDLVYKNNKQIERISESIGELSTALKEESEARKSVAKDVNEKIAAFKGALWLATALGGSAIAIFIGYLTGLIKF